MAEGMGVLFLVLVCCICVSPVTACLYGCICDGLAKSVHCVNINNRTLYQLLSEIPGDTLTFSIADSALLTSTQESESEEAVVLDLSHLMHLRTVSLTNATCADTDLALFNRIFSLREIHVTFCSVQRLCASQWSSLDDLVVLNCSHNSVKDIEEHAFESMTSLRALILSHNKLMHLPVNAFRDLTSLELVDLSYNRIEYIHPMTFYNMSHLRVLYLQHNQLHTLHSSTFTNLSKSLEVDLRDNLWDCNCGLYWLITADETVRNQVVDWENLVCNSPSDLKDLHMHNVNSEHLLCSAPEVDLTPSDVEIHNMHNHLLNCSAWGHPVPSIYWITPFGTLAHQFNRRWMSDSIPEYKHILWYAGQPTYFNSSIQALPNGSLAFHNFRYHFVGEYTCVMENPAGLTSVSVNVTIASNITHHFEFSLFIGFTVGLAFMFIGIIVGAVRMVAEKCCKCCNAPGQYKVDVTFVVDTPHGEEHIDYNFDQPYDYSPFTDGTWPRFTPFLPHWSPYHSPKKCVTPAEGLGDEEEIKDGSTIRDTLEDVRTRLRLGIERASGRLKNRTANVKMSTSKKIQTIKESTSQTMQTIKESGTLYVKNLGKTTGDYANRMKIGMAVGVHQVKSQVQSMKELCGTGNIAQTISVATVMADKDKVEEIGLKQLCEGKEATDLERGLARDADWDACQPSTSGTVSSTYSRANHRREASTSSSEQSCSLQSPATSSCKVEVHEKGATWEGSGESSPPQVEAGSSPVQQSNALSTSSCEEEEPHECDSMLQK